MTLNITIFLVLFGGWAFGKIFSKVKLPNILGMLIFGIITGYFLSPYIHKTLWDIEPSLKSMALIIILLRAGLTVSKTTLKKVGLTAALMSFLPCIIEGVSLTFIFQWLFDFKWQIAGLTGFMLSAVSPAVVVPSMLELKEQGYGAKNDAPTIVLAGASLDDVFAITMFSVFLKLSSSGSVDYFQSIFSIPVSIIAGIIPGIITGYFLIIFFQRNYIRATEKTLIVLMLALLLLHIGNLLHSAALLGIMTAGFILLEKVEYIAKELSQKLSKLWVPAEIILFVLIGLAVDVKIAGSAGLKGLAAISLGLIFRSLGVWLATAFSKLSIKERIFCMLAYLPKATVQAALGSIPLASGIKEGNIILAIAVLSILFTAPLGLFCIKLFGKKLLDIKFE